MILSLSMRALPRLLTNTYSSVAPLTTAAAAASDDSSPASSFAGYSKKYWTTVADHERQEKNFQQAVKQWRGQHYHEGLHPDMKHFLHSRKPWDAGFRLQFIKWLNLRDELKGDLSNREVAVLAGKLTTLADRPLLDRFWAEYDRRGLERHVVVENMRVNSLVETGLLPQAFEFNIRTETTLLKGLVKEQEILLNAKADAPQTDAVFAKAEAYAIELQEKWGKSAEYDAAIPNLAIVLYTNNGLLDKAEAVKSSAPAISEAGYRALIKAHWSLNQNHSRAHALFKELQASHRVGKGTWEAIAPVWEHMRINNISP